MSASWEVQESIYNALSANATFMASISNRIYDEPPTNSVYPYVTIGYIAESRDNNLGGLGYEVIATLDIYTKPGRLGYKQAKDILTKMNAVLNMKELAMATLKMVKIFYDNGNTERDGDIRIITARYRIKVQEN